MAPIRHAKGALVGRADLLARLLSELTAGPGFWTLTGPGGVGKISLALALADAAAAVLPGGTAVCDAAEILDPGALSEAVARAIGLDRGVTDERALVGRALEGLGEALVVLDNLEQIAEGAAPLLAEWAERAPSLRIVATSRLRLGLTGERLVEVPPLALPDAECDRLSTLAVSDAGALLLNVSARQAPRVLSDTDAPALAALLGALGGLPLAIELAAPRLRLLSPAQLLDRMNRQFDVLRGAAPDRPARHQALRVTIALSWDLLGPAQQAALCQIAQLSGPFPAEAAEAALADPDSEAFPLDLLEDLLDHSLIRRRERARFPGLPDLLEMLPSIHAFAREKADPELAAAAQRRIDRYYGSPGLFDGPEDLAAARAHAERANLTAALEGATARGDAAAAFGLIRGLRLTLQAHGPLPEAISRLSAVAQLPGLAPPERALVRLWLAESHLHAGALDPMPPLLDQSEHEIGEAPAARAELRRLRAEHLYHAGRLNEAQEMVQAALADPEVSGATRCRLALLAGTLAEQTGSPREAVRLLRDALVLAEAPGLSALRNRGLLELGWAWFVVGALGEAKAAWTLALDRSAAIGDRMGEARAFERLGQALTREGRLEEAEAKLKDAVTRFRRGGFALQEGGCLEQLARITMHHGRFEEAELGFREAISLLEGRQRWMGAAIVRGNLGTLLARMGRFHEAKAELLAAAARQAALGARPTIVHQNLAKVELFLGETASARARVTQALAEHEAAGRSIAAAFARTTLGQVCLTEGDPTRAWELLDLACTELRAGRDSNGLGTALGLLGLAGASLGRRAEAEAAFNEADSLLTRSGVREARMVLGVWRGRAAARLGDRAAAKAALAAAEAELAQVAQSGPGELGWEIEALTRELAEEP